MGAVDRKSAVVPDPTMRLVRPVSQSPPGPIPMVAGRAAVLLASSLMAVRPAPAGRSQRRPSSGSLRVPPRPRVVRVVAAENFWGSIAGQLGGVHAHVVSLITNPNTDPHSYEPTAADARVLAGSQMVVENGIGYDPWVDKLLSADGGHIVTLDVGTRLGLADGSNPHRWYDPGDVREVIGQMTADLQRLDPRDRAYFAAQTPALRDRRAGALRRRRSRPSEPSTGARRSGPRSRSSPCWPLPSAST